MEVWFRGKEQKNCGAVGPSIVSQHVHSVLRKESRRTCFSIEISSQVCLVGGVLMQIVHLKPIHITLQVKDALHTIYMATIS